ncbi:Ankyrin repeat domain containing protein [Pandoravirus salinus]|uniref:Ankyrin repeat domain containing protein n=1 Tax=Pandoravirus salinus TaxID=1349410 RepID=S4W043_9VIRU|nr:ankyrin repeat domain [Pandoravirus salinus]AGO83722.1 Ankyrin repeat domain containing protein [Pandoravirus salinus]
MNRSKNDHTGRRRRCRRRHKSRIAATDQDGYLIDGLVPCCAATTVTPTKSSTPGTGFGNLPDELVASILRHLPCLDLCLGAGRVCRQWHAVVHDAAALGKSLCASPAARNAFLQGPLMNERVGGVREGILLKKSIGSTRGRRRRPSIVLARMLAADSGHVDCMARLHAHSWYDGACLVPAAVRGHLNVLWYAHASGCPWHPAVCAAAEAYGRVDCLRYAHGAGCYWSGQCVEAGANGHTDVLRYAKEEGLVNGELTCPFAAAGGHVDTLRYACENGWPACSSLASYASRNGHLDVLKYVHESGGEWRSDAIRNAISGDHIDCLDYLLKNGCPGFDSACTWAAEEGRSETLVWLRAAGCPWDANTCAEAAGGGHLDMLVWLHRSGCPWDAETAEYAASGGHLHCLAYAVGHGCPFDEGDLLGAAFVGRNRACLDYVATL